MVDAPTDLFLGGKWVPAASGDRFEVYDPATGSTQVVVQLPAPLSSILPPSAARISINWKDASTCSTRPGHGCPITRVKLP